MARCEIRPFRSADFESARRLWASTEGLGSGPGDSPAAVSRFLERNPGLSLVAVEEDAVVAAVLCGHDGRRGYIYRLAVEGRHRRKGLAAEMVRRCLSGLQAAGLERVLILVQEDNAAAKNFWKSMGGRLRDDLVAFSIDCGARPEPPRAKR
jgi:N-acetylglutamate synthase